MFLVGANAICLLQNGTIDLSATHCTAVGMTEWDFQWQRVSVTFH